MFHPRRCLAFVEIVDGCRLDAACRLTHPDRRHRRFRLDLRAPDEHQFYVPDEGARREAPTAVHAVVRSDGPARESEARQASAVGRDDPREHAVEQKERALGAGILFDVHSSVEERSAYPSAPLAPAAAPTGLSGATFNAALAAGDEPNLQGQQNRFLDSEGASKATDSLAASVHDGRNLQSPGTCSRSAPASTLLSTLFFCAS